MERKSNAQLKKLAEQWKNLGKLRYALLLALAGICILLLPAEDRQEQAAEPQITAVEKSTEQRMEKILSKVAGAGNVCVMLTEENNGSVEYQTDLEELREGDRLESRTETVFGENSALIRRKTAPKYLGAVVVCEGGDSAEVRLELVKAACSLTGLTSDKVTVLKMKE